MLIAFISAIHGNLPALKAVIVDAKKRGADKIICCGDVTGNGPFPSEACLYLQENNIPTISGNYDIKVLNVIREGEAAAASLQKKKRELLIWTANQITNVAEQFIAGLPETIIEELPGKRRLLVVHGSPLSNDDDVYPSITAAGIKAKLANTNPDILVCGHTHIPFVKRAVGMLIINCGSAGQPVDGDHQPSYALLSVEEKRLHAHIIRFDYNVNDVVSALVNTSLPKGIQKDFTDGTKRRFLQ
jgi:putative phosphoesterase